MLLTELENSILLKEAEKEAVNGQKVNWKAFKTNLAGWAAQTSNAENRIDAITWLGIAGHPEAVRTYATTGYPGQDSLGKGVNASNSTDNPDFAGGYFTPHPTLEGSDRIELNPKYADIYNFNPSGSHTFAHELRHRGFSIIRRIPALIDNMPSEVRDALRTIDATDPRTTGMGAEHAMLYAMDRGGYQPENAEYWRSMYMACNQVVREWLAKQPIPQGAAEAFQEDLARIYGKPVELVAKGETPESDPEAIAAGKVEIVQVPKRLADKTDAPQMGSPKDQRAKAAARAAARDNATKPNTTPNSTPPTKGQDSRNLPNTALAQIATSGQKLPQSGSAVSELQQRLKSIGLYDGTVGGSWNIDVMKALRQFQQNIGVPVTGIPNSETLIAILNASG